ncbi:hypothetical protein [Virgibacillus kimchii]
MNQLKEKTKKAQELIEFAESKGWSEEELAKVINLLHSELRDIFYVSNLFGDSNGGRPTGEIVSSNTYTRS